MMNWFLNLSTRNKLYVSFGSIMFFVILMIYLSASQMNSVRKMQSDLVKIDFKTTQSLSEINSLMNKQRAQILEMMLLDSRASQKQIEKDILARREQIVHIFEQLKDDLRNNPVLLGKFLRLKAFADEYAAGRAQQVKMIYTGNLAQARLMGETSQKVIFNNINRETDEILAMKRLELDRAIALGEAKTDFVTLMQIFFGALLVGVIVLIVFYMNRIIARPLNEIQQFAEEISEGNLFMEPRELNRTDEVGQLSRSFNKMLGSLKEYASFSNKVASGELRITIKPKSENDVLALSLNSMVENLRKYTTELKEVADVLYCSSADILSGTAQLATSSAETASSISETTSTVEEVKKTSEISNKKSKEVLDVSEKAINISEDGQRSTSDTIEGMGRIGRQMETIAANIIELTEQSKSIAEIIATVNDLSGQSNLLSVNAAIEAARAGEHGKSFAVVAQEIRNLAEQSKQSTAQVKNILDDIRNAINSTVLATEQGEKIVDEGMKLAALSGESISNLISSISVTKDAALQTSVSSQEQVIGMNQIALAMESIKLASAQNAATTKQLETSARNLQQLGNKMKDMISRFQI